MSTGFCSRCWNYTDFCDCINYSYDLEVEPDSSIPPPPEEEQPEVGTVWYFSVPIRELSLLLESNGIDKVGLSLLLMQESLWSIAPPPGEEYLYLSVPVDRLPLRPPTLTTSTFQQYIQPWEFNFFNYNGPPLEKLATLAEKLMACNAKKTKVAQKACRAKELFVSFFDGFKVEEVPVPPELEAEILKLSGVLTPEQLLLILTTLVPIELLQTLDDNTLTAIDYDWVHNHLVDGTDPDIDYEDKKQKYKECFKENDLFCENGSYPFPPPSISVTTDTSIQRALKKPKADKTCDKWCQYLKHPRLINYNDGPWQPAKKLADGSAVPQWVQDLIQKSLDAGGNGSVNNYEIPSKPPRGKVVTVTNYKIMENQTPDGKRFWLPAKDSKVTYKMIAKRKHLNPEQAAENERLAKEFLASKMTSRSTVRPVFDDIILYDSDDEDNFVRIPSQVPPLAPVLAYPIVPGTSIPKQINPVAYQLLTLPANQSTFPNTGNSRLHHIFRNDGTVETHIHTEQSSAPVSALFPVPNLGNSLAGAQQILELEFIWLGDVVNDPYDPVIIVTNGLDVQTVTADSNRIGRYGLSNMSSRMTNTPHIMYQVLTFRGGNTAIESTWVVNRIGVNYNNFTGINNKLQVARDLKFVPPLINFNAKGFATETSMILGTPYSSPSMTLNDHYQLPMAWFMRRVAFVRAYPNIPNIVVGQNGFFRGMENTGDDSGTLMIPYWPGYPAPTSVSTRTYDFTLSKVAGENMLLIGLHTIVVN